MRGWVLRGAWSPTAPRPPLLGLVKISVFPDKSFLPGWKFVSRKDSVRRTEENTCAAVDTCVGIDVKLWKRFEIKLVFLGMNTIGGASVDAEFVLDARISNYVCHDPVLTSCSLSNHNAGAGTITCPGQERPPAAAREIRKYLRCPLPGRTLHLPTPAIPRAPVS